MGPDLLAGLAFKMLYDAVKQAVRCGGKYTTLLRELESTLDSLQETVIQQIGEHNDELGLPNEEIESLQKKMEDGAKLIDKLTKFRCLWMSDCFNGYGQQIVELDRALKELLTKLKMQEARDVKEVLVLSRQNFDSLNRLDRRVSNIQTAVRTILNFDFLGCDTEQDALACIDPMKGKKLAGGQVESTNLSKQPGRIMAAMNRKRAVKFVTSSYFSQLQEVGEGSSGTVYKAQLDGGQVVFIKPAEKVLFEHLQTEFSSEVELLTKIDHPNLVKLLGYVDEGNERLIITEYVANGTLREHLDGQYGKILEFNQRLEIAVDVADGLTYLHLYLEGQIIHRDVKSSNILLTESMRAKVADFGFSTKEKGTIGYIDPEYGETGQLTPKCDVYSFGILLIEIVTGRRPVELKRPVEERVTLEWASKKFNEGKVVELVDPSMKEVVEAELLVKTFDLAIQCAAPVGADRPDMYSVGVQLQKLREDYLGSVKTRERVTSIP